MVNQNIRIDNKKGLLDNLMHEEMKHLKRLLIVLFFITSTTGFSQPNYTNYIDSAEYYLDQDPEMGLRFLNKIPDPIESSVKGSVSEYFDALAFGYYYQDNLGEAYRNMLLAAKWAEKEKKYNKAGKLFIEVFTLYRQTTSKSNEKLLQSANKNFSLANNQDGVLDVKQARIYALYFDGEMEKCLKLNLADIDDFNLSSRKFTALTANYMIASCYLNLDSLVKGKDYVEIVKQFKNQSGVEMLDVDFYLTSLNVDFADYYARRKESKLGLKYLKKIAKNKQVLDHILERQYYELGVEINRLEKNTENVTAYLDSLSEYDIKMQDLSMQDVITTSEKLLKNEDAFKVEKTTSSTYGVYLVLLVVVVLVLLSLLFFFRRRIKNAARVLKIKIEETFTLKTKQQKLSEKLNRLEGYFSAIKTEVKEISTHKSGAIQREKLQNLYKEINITTNELQDKDHLTLINRINEDFFSNLQYLFPKLIDSEIILCYYLFLGFKNKEIAEFLNSTTRAVESKRYRVSKKMNLSFENKNVVDHIQEMMKTHSVKNN